MSQLEPSAPQVLLIAAEGIFDGLRDALASEGLESQTIASARGVGNAIEENPRCVAVLDADMPQAGAFEVYKLLREHESIPVLMLVPAESYRTFLLDPLRGANEECVAKPVENDELVLRVKALMFRAGFRPTAAVASDTDQHGRTREAPGKLITVFHAKCGVGASTVASNLAVGLARLHEYRVLLVDADLWFGDLAVLMNAPAKQSLFDTLVSGDFEPADLRRALVHHDSGVYLLLRPDDPSVAERLDPGLVTRAIASCRATFDFVIVDTPPTLGEMTLQILDVAQQILLVTTPELAAVHNSARFLRIADAIGYASKISIVLNRANSGIPTELLEEHLALSARVTLPSAGRLVVDAANRGVPLMAVSELDGNDEMMRGLLELIELVAPTPPPTPPVDPVLPPQPEPSKPKSGRFFWR
jgi:pilus assembly protein CpaE